MVHVYLLIMAPKDLSLYHLIRPSVNTEEPSAALIMMHGYGSNEEDLFSFAPEMPEDLFVISLRAPHALQPFGYAWYAINFEAEKGKWNDTAQAVESREAILHFIGEAITAYNLDPSRINLLGFSQGSILGYALALSYPERIRTLVALSGYLDPSMLVAGFESKKHEDLEIYASHGQADMVIPPAWAQKTAASLKQLGLSHVYEEYPVGHGVSMENFRSFLQWLTPRY